MCESKDNLNGVDCPVSMATHNDLDYLSTPLIDLISHYRAAEVWRLAAVLSFCPCVALYVVLMVVVILLVVYLLATMRHVF